MNDSGIQRHRTVRWPGHRAGTALLALGALGALGIAAAAVRSKTREAERLHPPIGQFIEVDKVRLHYIERGAGQPVVLLHGNGSMVEDLAISGLLDRVASRYRVIAFDRPGYGHSERPRDRVWTPLAQARLLHRALQQIGVENPIMAGHSWGALVAIALALEFPESVKSLVLLSGYYYPSLRVDSALASPSAAPVLGELLNWTIAPLLGRLLWPALVRKLFAPSPAPDRFREYPVWMALRSSQLRASAAESAMMAPAALSLSRRYRDLTMPIVALAGTGDQIANAQHHTVRLHQELQHSHLRLKPEIGHMVHYLAPEAIMAAIDSADEASTILQPMAEAEYGAAAEAHLGRT